MRTHADGCTAKVRDDIVKLPVRTSRQTMASARNVISITSVHPPECKHPGTETTDYRICSATERNRKSEGDAKRSKGKRGKMKHPLARVVCATMLINNYVPLVHANVTFLLHVTRALRARHLCMTMVSYRDICEKNFQRGERRQLLTISLIKSIRKLVSKATRVLITCISRKCVTY